MANCQPAHSLTHSHTDNDDVDDDVEHDDDVCDLHANPASCRPGMPRIAWIQLDLDLKIEFCAHLGAGGMPAICPAFPLSNDVRVLHCHCHYHVVCRVQTGSDYKSLLVAIVAAYRPLKWGYARQRNAKL